MNFSFTGPNETVGQDEVIQERQAVKLPTTKIETTEEDSASAQWFEDVQQSVKMAVSDFNKATLPEEVQKIIRGFKDYKIKVLGTFPGPKESIYFKQARHLFNEALYQMEFTTTGAKTGAGMVGALGVLGVALGAYFIFK
jgi:hypothetical protein